MLPGILGTVHINNREPLSKTAALCFILSKKSFCGKMISEVFAGLFQKAADSKGRAFGRVPQDAKSSAFIKIRKGDAAARWVAASRETLSRDFPMRREAAFVQAAAGKRVSRQTERAAAKEIVLRKNDTKGFRVRIRRTRAAIFQKATLATAAGGGRREQGLAPRSATGEAACPPMTEPGTARGSQGFALERSGRETRQPGGLPRLGKPYQGGFRCGVRPHLCRRQPGNGFPGRRRKPLPKTAALAL